MNTLQGHAQLVAETARTMLRLGQQPVLVWLPLGKVFDSYLCELIPGDVPTYRAIVSLGRTTGKDDAYQKSGIAWAAMEAGAAFKRFNRRANAAGPRVSRIVFPTGNDVHAI